MYCFNLYDNVANDYMSLKQYGNDDDPIVEYNWGQQAYVQTNSPIPTVFCGKTNPQLFKLHSNTLCTIDVIGLLLRLFIQF